jgi:DNA-binding CsgD family transcriptional regulator/tetratricopeptide (TPR) repeat protein
VDLLEREAALAALGDARESAARGRGRIALVSGEPGIGKSSLVRRFARDVDGAGRVLFGSCDDLAIPRPLGPFRDLAGSVSPELDEALRAGAAPHELQALLLAELELPPRPAVLVIEDVHWADDATLDSIAILSRRVADLHALLVLTFRGGEAPPAHPLRVALGAVRGEDLVTIELQPLSRVAVAALAGDDAEALYTATGGNPFYVTELLAARDSEDPPASVANAVLGRMARLDPDSRRLVELVSVVPGRVGTAVLDVVIPGWPAAAEEPERRQLLEVDGESVHFRHELARNVIRASLPAAARRRLHAEILGALLAGDADPSDVVHHAEAAGAEDVVSEYALVAARRAATLESNREAFFHFRRAADFFDSLEPDARAEALEELAMAAYLVGRLDHAFEAIEQAIAIHSESRDRAAIGRCARVLSRLHWFIGDGEPARAKALQAVAILEPLGESVELARAYSGVSQLAMLEDDERRALHWGKRALELASRLGDESTRAHALVNIGCAKVQRDRRETQTLLDAHATADAAGEREDATRALGNLGYVLMSWADPRAARRYAERALAYAERYEVHAYVSYVTTLLAWLRLRAGDWSEAERITRGEVERGITVVQLLAKTVLTELAVRRGDSDAAARLSDLTAHAERAAELQRVAPVVELMAERALCGEGRMPIERFEQLAEVIGPDGRLAGRFGTRLVGWAAVADIPIGPEDPGPGPYAAMRRRDWRVAADAFGALGWSHDRALMLSLTEDDAALAEALETARLLGAAPLTRRVSERMRELGMRVPQGPRRSTRKNPAGLTARQLEVLALLSQGLSNAEIAERLVVSPRTAEHHVSAVLTKLDAGSRRDVVRRAEELGII